MKRFIIRISILVIILILLDIFFGLAMNYMTTHAKGGDTARTEYICNHTKEDLIILGSSRAIHHYKPSILSDSLEHSCYNCGYDGCGIVLSTCELQMMLKRYHPKYILYELTPSFDFVAGDNIKYIKNMRPYYFQGSMDAVVDSLDKTERFKCYSSFYRYNSNFFKIWKDYRSKEKKETDNGYRAMTKISPDEPTRNKDYTDIRPTDTLKLHLLENFIRTCKQNNIKIIFSVSPLYTGDSTTKVFGPMFTILRKEGITILDHSCDKRFCRKRKYFADSCHLTDEGATEYTKVIASELKNIIQ